MSAAARPSNTGAGRNQRPPLHRRPRDQCATRNRKSTRTRARTSEKAIHYGRGSGARNGVLAPLRPVVMPDAFAAANGQDGGRSRSGPHPHLPGVRPGARPRHLNLAQDDCGGGSQASYLQPPCSRPSPATGRPRTSAPSLVGGPSGSPSAGTRGPDLESSGPGRAVAEQLHHRHQLRNRGRPGRVLPIGREGGGNLPAGGRTGLPPRPAKVLTGDLGGQPGTNGLPRRGRHSSWSGSATSVTSRSQTRNCQTPRRLQHASYRGAVGLPRQGRSTRRRGGTGLPEEGQPGPPAKASGSARRRTRAPNILRRQEREVRQDPGQPAPGSPACPDPHGPSPPGRAIDATARTTDQPGAEKETEAHAQVRSITGHRITAAYREARGDRPRPRTHRHQAEQPPRASPTSTRSQGSISHPRQSLLERAGRQTRRTTFASPSRTTWRTAPPRDVRPAPPPEGKRRKRRDRGACLRATVQRTPEPPAATGWGRVRRRGGPSTSRRKANTGRPTTTASRSRARRSTTPPGKDQTGTSRAGPQSKPGTVRNDPNTDNHRMMADRRGSSARTPRKSTGRSYRDRRARGGAQARAPDRWPPARPRFRPFTNSPEGQRQVAEGARRFEAAGPEGQALPDTFDHKAVCIEKRQRPKPGRRPPATSRHRAVAAPLPEGRGRENGQEPQGTNRRFRAPPRDQTKDGVEAQEARRTSSSRSTTRSPSAYTTKEAAEAAHVRRTPLELPSKAAAKFGRAGYFRAGQGIPP